MTGKGQGPVLILGPTASGKSALALRIAAERGGIVVNADSMQVYDVLDRLTARPDAAMQATAPHRLYGHVSPSRAYSVGMWLEDVRAVVAEAGDRPLVFVGGTGLYFRALLGGLADLPDIPPAIRALWRDRLAAEGADSLHRLLRDEDPDAARAIRPGDGQRIVRALEVKAASGRPLSALQREKGSAAIDAEAAEKLLLVPPRETLYARIDARFARMVEMGAAEEVQALLALGLDPALPAMKAIGVVEIADALAGRTTMEHAIALASTRTRHYAKRQMTWIRHQTGPGWSPVG